MKLLNPHSFNINDCNSVFLSFGAAAAVKAGLLIR